jgi:hypothetical protein
MKALLITAFLLSPALSVAAIEQPMNGVDDPVVRVLGGEQRNGTVAIENLETRVTIGAGESLLPTIVATAERDFSGAGPSFSAGVSSSSVLLQVLNPVSDGKASVLNHIAPMTNSPKSPAVVTPVPEPETYALMGLGLAALILRRKKRI